MTSRARFQAAAPAVSPPAAGPATVRAVPTFERFYRDEVRGVIALAFSLTGDWAHAEDLAQEAFLAAHQRWDTVGRYDKPGAWVRRVVANRSVSRIRRRVREAKALVRLGAGDDGFVPRVPAEDEAFWQAVRELPRRQAQAIALYYLEDRSVNEIAEILECAPNTVKVHLHKARRSLAIRLGEGTGAPGGGP